MKYLVNRETKEHRIHPSSGMYASGDWHVVEADAEGWIKWDGGECPLPDDCPVYIKLLGDIPKQGYEARQYCWSHKYTHDDIVAYRPILNKPFVSKTDESPAKDFVPEQQCNDLLARLKSAHEAAQTIPDLLAELREKLAPIGLGVMYLSEFNAVDPDPEPDMSDWRNWRAKDHVMCVIESKPFIKGRIYEVIRGVDCDGFVVIEGYNVRDTRHNFRFHSRPEAS